MKMGTQVAYIPAHVDRAALGDNLFKDSQVELGFVMAEAGGDTHFVRYWRQGHLGELRTVANSERTPTILLVEHESVDQAVVEKKIDEILGIGP